MSYRYHLFDVEGESLGFFAVAVPTWKIGDEFDAGGGRRYRILRERSVAIPPGLAEELWQHRRRTRYQGDGELVFCHPDGGTVYRYEWFAAALREAHTAAGIEFPEGMRPCHDLRVTSLTNGAIAGESPVVLMTRAGHANMGTTKRYLRLAGVVFQQEAAALEARLLNADLLPDSSTRLTASDVIERDPTSLGDSVDA